MFNSSFITHRSTLLLISFAACLLLFQPASHALSGRPDLACESAESCYREALGPLIAPIAKSPREIQTLAVIERLKIVRERYPDSVWASRAGLLLGVLVRDSDPASSLGFLKSAQPAVPVIDDYIRLWTGETLLRVGDAAQAAAQFESIPEAVPGTLLTTRATYRSGMAWYMAGDCRKAEELLRRAIVKGPQDPGAPAALLNLADCHLRENRDTEAQAALAQLWVNYPQAPEARDAEARLTRLGGAEPWRPTPDDLYARALALFGQALNEEAATELRKFLSRAPAHPSRTAARSKLGTVLVRLKRYDQASQVFQEVAAEGGTDSAEATVWLARIYLRQGEGERLLVMPPSLSRLPLTGEQKASVYMFAGTWQDDQEQYDTAIVLYEQAAKLAETATLRADALWRIGWIHYRTGRFADAVDRLHSILGGKEDPQYTPQALYWTGRSLERLNDPKSADLYRQLCRQYVYTYYCQLARRRVPMQPSANGSEPGTPGPNPADGRAAVQRDVHHQRAVELRLLGMEPYAALELAWLVDRYGKNRDTLLELSVLLSEAGAYNQALRLVRANFRDLLEKGGTAVPLSLWNVAYPTAYLPYIRVQAGGLVDPYLVAAIIREESQYDARAVSRVGAVGLMQVMPVTAKAVAKRQGLPDVAREDLFDQETNIRFGIQYLEQLLQQFSGNVMYAVAAYNAGPQAVTAWAAKHGGRESDEFVELIPYQETRQYVKKVLRSYREYHRLSGSTCDSGFLDKTC